MKSTEEKLLLRRRGGGSVIERSPVFSSDAEYVLIYYYIIHISRLCICATGCKYISLHTSSFRMYFIATKIYAMHLYSILVCTLTFIIGAKELIYNKYCIILGYCMLCVVLLFERTVSGLAN